MFRYRYFQRRRCDTSLADRLQQRYGVDDHKGFGESDFISYGDQVWLGIPPNQGQPLDTRKTKWAGRLRKRDTRLTRLAVPIGVRLQASKNRPSSDAATYSASQPGGIFSAVVATFTAIGT